MGGRVRRLGKLGADLFPLTPLGLLVAVGAGAALRKVAFAQLDLVLLVVGYGGLGLVATALLFVVLAAVRIAFAMRGARAAPERTLETGRSLPTGLVVPRLVWLPFVRVRWTWARPEASLELVERRLGLVEHATLRERGTSRTIERRMVVEDAFGLARIAWRHEQHTHLICLPHVGALRQLPLLVSMAGGDDIPHPMGVAEGDRTELRRYAPGDPARLIHWKVFGRTRQLMVRMPERALTRARRTVSYLVAGSADEASAAAARVAVESGALGADWVFAADGSTFDASEAHEAVAQIVASVAHRGNGASGLRGFVDRAERMGPASLVLFVPPVPGPWLARALAVVGPRGDRTRIVVATDGLDTRAPQPAWWRWVLRAPAPGGTTARDLDAVVRSFAALRCEVVVLDRTSGRRLGEAHRKALEALGGEARSEAAA
ncbi:MAG: hypothetical protein OHK0013_47060 [Sandaracinaceae bacterium]